MKRKIEVTLALLALPVMAFAAVTLLNTTEDTQEIVKDVDMPVNVSESAIVATPIHRDIEPEELALIDKSNIDEAPKHASDILARVETTQSEYVATLTPNDASYPTWFWTTLGAEDAWDVTTGDSSTVVAVIDSGYGLGHEDLSDGWWTNSGEIGTTTAADICWTGSAQNKQSNSCDDDNNGYIDDWRGYDFANSDNSTQAGEVNPTGDGVSHGTLVAGFIGAASNNSVGFPGLNWQAQIMPLQALTDDGSGFTTDIVAAIEYAVDNGANIINLSLSGAGSDPAMEAAVSYARSNNVLVFASSGNCATLSYTFCSLLDAPGYMGYPALYDDVISVGATRIDNVRASFSSYGPTLELVAPGSNLSVSTDWTSTNGTNAYAAGLSGTSFAAPIAAAVGSLILSANPELTAEQARQILIGTSQLPGGGGIYDNEYGFGIISAKRAIETAASNGSANLSRTSSNQPLLITQPGTNPGSPLGPSEAVVSSVASYGGDQVSVEAENISTGAKNSVAIGIKLDETGQADISWNTSTLSTGSWRIRVQGLQLVSDAKIIYVD